MNQSLPPIRVLVVDDSAFMRRAITKMLEKQSDIEIAGTANSGEEAIKLSEELKPDVITMDVEMPGMGGLQAVQRIVERHGPPVIMVSAVTREGAEVTLRALELGAVDFIPKPDSAYIDILKVASDLIAKVQAFGRRGGARRIAPPPPRPPAPPLRTPDAIAAPPRRVPPVAPSRPGRYECVALGTSTGGPVALSRILPLLPAAFPIPVIVVQHMPPGFTRPLADRLNGASAIDVVEGDDGLKLRGGLAVIAPAGKQLVVRREGGSFVVRLQADTQNSLHVPSVDVMAGSVGEVFGTAALGVILTGMGHDGVDGLKVIKARGGYVVGQDEASSVVYGMPRAAAQAGLVDRVVALDEVARTLCEIVGVPASA